MTDNLFQSLVLVALHRAFIFGVGYVITSDLCYSTAHVSAPSRFVSPIPHIHHIHGGPIVPLEKAWQCVCNQKRHSNSQLQFRFNLESLHLTLASLEKPTIWRRKNQGRLSFKLCT